GGDLAVGRTVGPAAAVEGAGALHAASDHGVADRCGHVAAHVGGAGHHAGPAGRIALRGHPAVHVAAIGVSAAAEAAARRGVAGGAIDGGGAVGVDHALAAA